MTACRRRPLSSQNRLELLDSSGRYGRTPSSYFKETNMTNATNITIPCTPTMLTALMQHWKSSIATPRRAHALCRPPCRHPKSLPS